MSHTLTRFSLLFLTAALLLTGSNTTGAVCQEPVDIQAVLAEANSTNTDTGQLQRENWWDQAVMHPIGSSPDSIPVDVNQLLFLALKNSAQIQVYSDVPLIRETAVEEAAAAFDWTRFAETMWNDLSEPVGSSLTIGGAGTRFSSDQWTASAGLRKRTVGGGQFDITQQVGWQNTNSNFFVPNNQGTARLTLGFTQPLLRGRGQVYNQSLIVLANIDVATANEEFKRQLQSHLLEVVRGYWALYLERASLAQKVALYLRTKAIVSELQARQHIDAGRSQRASAEAALENRRADLIRTRAAVQNAETRLRALINAEELANGLEFIPQQPPAHEYLDTDSLSEIETAVQNRPEVVAALKQIKASCVRLNMAEHEMLPQLNLITRAYVAGLQGNSEIGQAFVDQFGVGAPSYSVGLQYEVPIGRRAANARLTRRLIEARQLQQQYRTSLENVKAEVEVAVRELQTSWREMFAKHRSMESARAEAATLEARWKLAADGGVNGLNLESLLRAQERLTEMEFEFLSAQLTYNLSLMNLKRANGTLLVAEQIQIGRTNDCGVPEFELEKSDWFAGDSLGSGVYEDVVLPETEGEPQLVPSRVEGIDVSIAAPDLDPDDVRVPQWLLSADD